MRKFKTSNKQRREITSALSMVTQIGLTMTITVLIAIFAGNALDSSLNTSPVFLLIFVVLGAGAAFRNLFKLTKKFVDELPKEKEEEKP